MTQGAQKHTAAGKDERRPGRRPGGGDTRGTVLEAARILFADTGYEATTIRAVAAAADVHPALVTQFYGSKDGLFRAVLAALTGVREQLSTAAGPGPDRGLRVVRAYLGLWEAPETGSTLRALARGAVGSQRATRMLEEFIGAADNETGPPPTALLLAAGQLLGIAIARYVLAAGPLAQMPLEELATALAPAIQAQLDQ